MSHEGCAGGEVGGKAREWGGVVQVAAHFSLRPTRQIVIMIPFFMFESSLNLFSRIRFVLWFSMLNLYSVIMNVQYYFVFKFHITAVVHRDSNYTDE